MTYKVYLCLESANFNAAVGYVTHNYPHLFHPSLQSITLKQSHRHRRGADGLHTRIGEKSYITIRHEYAYGIPHFIEVLVHELTHLLQYASGRSLSMTEELLEEEAYTAGQAALKEYQSKVQRSDLAWIRKKLSQFVAPWRQALLKLKSNNLSR
jgi:hypothetical protein